MANLGSTVKPRPVHVPDEFGLQLNYYFEQCSQNLY